MLNVTTISVLWGTKRIRVNRIVVRVGVFARGGRSVEGAGGLVVARRDSTGVSLYRKLGQEGGLKNISILRSRSRSRRLLRYRDFEYQRDSE